MQRAFMGVNFTPPPCRKVAGKQCSPREVTVAGFVCKLENVKSLQN